ncbi:T-cell surface glycoprotein CD1b-like isoform X1 [Sciurus carolinensis]|uniref:T-cell surface glycoprotein CD1b-like isoform X1 n=1 Tax=Sciurus carolinensis TaxID=30640 RepID=UPI001FB2FD6E|nr:T-cell surface glycoprotein CD1b-like isoform X1 [Sciurus carolinensis]
MRDQTPAESQKSSVSGMLLLLLVLLAVLFPGGDNQEASQGPTSYRVMQISSFANSTWTQNRGSGWLDDLQIHGWNSDTGTAIFLKPWSKGNLSDEEVTELEEIFRVYFFGFTREVQERISDLQLEYPFEIQGVAGCELHSGGTTESFLKGAIEGLEFLSINYTCWPSPGGGSRAEKVCELVAKYKGIFDTIENLLYETCPRYLLSVLEAGKEDLQRQVKPKVWLSSGPSPRPGHLLLVCHVSGFYPKHVWVMWMRGEQEQLGTQQGDFLPNVDGTWYLRATLDVAAKEAGGLACRVKHSSLGGQDLVLYWGSSISIGLIILAVIVPCLVFLMGLTLWFWRRWSYQDI